MAFDLSHLPSYMCVFSCQLTFIVGIDTSNYKSWCKFIFSFNNKRRSKISAHFHVFFEYKRMRLFLSVYSISLQGIIGRHKMGRGIRPKATPLSFSPPQSHLNSPPQSNANSPPPNPCHSGSSTPPKLTDITEEGSTKKTNQTTETTFTEDFNGNIIQV